MPAELKLEPGAKLGKYPILRELGSGATSRVFLGRDTFAERDVAIKVFLFDHDADPQTERMRHKAFVAESSLVGKLNHPHIVGILDAVVEPDHSYVVMEYVPGVTLEAHADVATLLPVGKVVEIVFKCIRALEYAFQHGVIHRDIKPGNILLSEGGEAKVGDFGASFQQRARQETTQISGVGSPAYMSPEQIRMDPLTHQTDIYSLGVTMYRLLTGRLPFQVSTTAALTYAILNVAPPAPTVIRPDVPALLERVVLKAMSREPAERYASWLEFGKDLSQAFVALRLSDGVVSDSERFNTLRAFDFFRDFNDVSLWEVVRIGRWAKFSAGTAIIGEGEAGDDFFLLVAGEVMVTLGGKAIATLRAGQCFGEVMYFADQAQRRTTTVRANGDVTAIVIRASAMRTASDACQAVFTRACMRVLIERLTHANRRLAAAA